MSGYGDIIEGLKDPKGRDNTKLLTPLRKRVNQELRVMNGYFEGVPLKEIDMILRTFGLIMIDDDGTEWSGLLTGRDGRDTFDIAFIESYDESFKVYTAIENSVLSISWHRMESGRTEIVTYLS